MRSGDRVDTPYGAGTVAYVRMAWPEFTVVEAVSVVLDEKVGKPGYVGTIVSPDDVTEAEQ